jgi:hypothetical protein
MHQAGNEVAWWNNLKINALEIARGLWGETHGRTSGPDQHTLPDAPDSASAVSADNAPAK